MNFHRLAEKKGWIGPGGLSSEAHKPTIELIQIMTWAFGMAYEYNFSGNISSFIQTRVLINSLQYTYDSIRLRPKLPGY